MLIGWLSSPHTSTARYFRMENTKKAMRISIQSTALLLLCCSIECSGFRSALHHSKGVGALTRITAIRGGQQSEDNKSVSMQLMITSRMREVLVNDLKYLPEEVEAMDPQVAAIVIERGLSRPAKGMPKAWRRRKFSNMVRIGSLKDGGKQLLSLLRKRWHYVVLASILSVMAGKVVVHKLSVQKRANELRKLPTWQLPDYAEDETTEDALTMVMAERLLGSRAPSNWLRSTFEGALKSFKQQ